MPLKGMLWPLPCLCLFLLCCHDSLPCLRPNTVETAGRGLKTLTVTYEINFFLIQGIVIATQTERSVHPLGSHSVSGQPEGNSHSGRGNSVHRLPLDSSWPSPSWGPQSACQLILPVLNMLTVQIVCASVCTYVYKYTCV